MSVDGIPSFGLISIFFKDSSVFLASQEIIVSHVKSLLECTDKLKYTFLVKFLIFYYFIYTRKFLTGEMPELAEGARLEIVCPERSGPWVRIPLSPP